MKLFFLQLGLLAGAIPAAAQQIPALSLTCPAPAASQALQKLHCETRDLTLPAPAAGNTLTIDARANGGITVRGWNGTTVKVRALVTGRAATAADARALVAAVRITAQNSTLRASRANESLDGWAVEYEVLVPARTDLDLKAVNGAIKAENVAGKLRLNTTNGPLVLLDVSGDVRGQTTNGSLTLRLSGPAWAGPGLEVSTVNGAVDWQLPAVYAATILARTTHGKVSAELNTKRKSVLPHNLAATLGKGGAQLKVSTVHGSISVKQPAETAPVQPDPVE
ncbi:DUF4097 family beta strand repeat-containing protein [Hymenobacter metallilatus]|uniref:DUF4097 domain-containing protein n=1 Tax=Hymenobacter metallilatus TaxID=2493666 RepID=A0A3R9MFD9_9BACT|nr:DUF4097 family beta strand repeat-containing protein [Hymenobacter metallilatus]RSK29614.1 hypothetical protein EI290_17245 [Hymenobacter metallilatus]